MSLPAPSEPSNHLLKSISSKLLRSLRRSSSDANQPASPPTLTTQLSNLGSIRRGDSSDPSRGLLEPNGTPRASGQLSRGTSDPALLHSPSKRGFFFKNSPAKTSSNPEDLARAGSDSPLLSTLAATTLSRISEDRTLLDNRNEASDAAADASPLAQDSGLGVDEFSRDAISRQESEKRRMSFAAVGESLRSNFKTAAAKITKSKKTLIRTLPIVDTWVTSLRALFCTTEAAACLQSPLLAALNIVP